MFHAAALLAQTSPAPAPPCDTKSCKPEAEILGNETQAFGSGCQAPGSGSDLPVWQRKVTLVTTGATDADDGNFNSLAISGAMAACTVENQCCLEVDMPHGTDTDYFCELLYAADDSHLVIGVGHLHAQAVAHAAGCVANKRFAAIDVEFASHPNKNLEGFIFRDAQAGFMAGMIAGMVAKLGTKKVGIAAGPGIPPVARFTTGFTNGVAHADACPECSSTLVSCEFAHMGAGNEFPDCGNAFACPACGIKRVQTLLAAGVDVIFSAGGMTGAAGLKYAAAPKGTVVFGVEKTEVATAYVVGVDADEWVTQFDKGLAPGAEKIITSAMKNVDIAVKQVRTRHDGQRARGHDGKCHAPPRVTVSATA